MVESGLVSLGELLTMLFDVGRSLNLFLGDCYLQLVGAQIDPGKRHKGQGVAR